MRPKQLTLAETGFEKHRKVTRRAQFLAEMNTVVPWAQLIGLIEHFIGRVEERLFQAQALPRQLDRIELTPFAGAAHEVERLPGRPRGVEYEVSILRSGEVTAAFWLRTSREVSPVERG